MLNPFETYNKLITKPESIQKEMVVTIYISKNPTYIHMPIIAVSSSNNFKIDRNIRIEWGDGQSTELYNGQTIERTNTILNHKYTSTGYKEVKIISEDGTIPQWDCLQTTYYDSSNSTKNITNYLTRYDTPLLKTDIENQNDLGFVAGVNNEVNLEYMDGHIFKNNSHLTNLPNLRLSESVFGGLYAGMKGCAFTLDRNILLDLPNLTSIDYCAYLFSKQQTNYDVEMLFEGCPNIISMDLYGSYYFDVEGGRFPNIFKILPNLTTAYCAQSNHASNISYTKQVTSIPEDLFRYNPKLRACSRLFMNQAGLDTSNISFTKGGFFAENWEPDGSFNMKEFMPSMNANIVNTGNAQELYETLQTLPNGYNATSAIYNNTKMVGYSSVPSSWRTNPF